MAEFSGYKRYNVCRKMSHVMRKHEGHPRSLISAFVVRCLDSIIPILAKSKLLRL